MLTSGACQIAHNAKIYVITRYSKKNYALKINKVALYILYCC